jgi:hypothetical protein
VVLDKKRLVRFLSCRLGLRHRWTVQSTEDGERYQRCSRCGKDVYRSIPHWISGANG